MARLERDAKRAALLASPLFQAMRAGGTRRDPEVRIGAPRPPRADDLPEGDNGSSLMAVLRGRVRISSVSGDGKEVTLNVINPGEIFGEIALLDGEPRSADATAIEDTLLLVVERRHFLPFLRQNEDLYPAPARGAVRPAAAHQHGAGGDRAVRSAGAPRARAAEAGGGLRPAERRAARASI